jgi:hypothetical protein
VSSRPRGLASIASLACLAALGSASFATGASARLKLKVKVPHAKEQAQDPARWFATRTGLIRVYQERPKGASAKGKKAAAQSARESEDGAPPPVGASCEVVESTPKEDAADARTKERCTMIAARKAKTPASLTYELRPAGIFMVRAETEGQKPAVMERLLLPAVKKGKTWSEKRGAVQIVRTVKSAGASCKASSRSFGDCLVLKVVEKEGKKVRRTYSEIYAAGVGLVEDAQWELIDVKGL